MSNRNGSTRRLENTERIFIAQNESYVSRISSGYSRMCAFAFSLSASASRYRSFFTAIEAPYQYGGSCALAIVRSVWFRVEKQDEQQQTTTTTTNNNKLADAKSLSTLPSRDPFSTPHCPPPPSLAIAPITSMTVSILRYRARSFLRYVSLFATTFPANL